MAQSFEKLLDGRHSVVLLGEAGCGKSEIALNLAAAMAAKRETHLFDMDQTKPLYRSRDARDAMEKSGVAFHYERQFFDAPTLAGGVAESLNEKEKLQLELKRALLENEVLKKYQEWERECYRKYS